MRIEGPHFVYDDAPSLFLGRKGFGPLEVVWDTNILLDYLEHGSDIWEGEEFDTDDEEYQAELEGLEFIINLWMRRDIRFRIYERTVSDAKRGLPAHERKRRGRVVDEIARALSLDMWAERDNGWQRGPSAPRWAADSIPAGADRDLVQTALGQGAHVFLTRDARVLRSRSYLAPMGLLLASPLDLFEELVSCGAMLAVMRPETMYWPLPDLQRASHLIQALAMSQETTLEDLAASSSAMSRGHVGSSESDGV